MFDKIKNPLDNIVDNLAKAKESIDLPKAKESIENQTQNLVDNLTKAKESIDLPKAKESIENQTQNLVDNLVKAKESIENQTKETVENFNQTVDTLYDFERKLEQITQESDSNLYSLIKEIDKFKAPLNKISIQLQSLIEIIDSTKNSNIQKLIFKELDENLENINETLITIIDRLKSLDKRLQIAGNQDGNVVQLIVVCQTINHDNSRLIQIQQGNYNEKIQGDYNVNN